MGRTGRLCGDCRRLGVGRRRLRALGGKFLRHRRLWRVSGRIRRAWCLGHPLRLPGWEEEVVEEVVVWVWVLVRVRNLVWRRGGYCSL